MQDLYADIQLMNRSGAVNKLKTYQDIYIIPSYY